MNIIPKGRLVRTEVFVAVLLMEACSGGSPEDRAPGEGGTAGARVLCRGVYDDMVAIDGIAKSRCVPSNCM